MLETPKAYSHHLGNSREDVTMGNQQATDAEIGWLAGIIDGEGWLGMSVETEHWYRVGYNTRQKSIKVEIKVTNCDPAVVYKTAEIIQKLGVNPYIRAQGAATKPNHRQAYEVSVKRLATVKHVLNIVRPYLIGTKAERADLILRFIELRQSNPGIPNPHYADGGKGKKGPGTIRPYTTEELEIVEQCRALQSRKGASETTRATGEAMLAQMKANIARLRKQDNAEMI